MKKIISTLYGDVTIEAYEVDGNYGICGYDVHDICGNYLGYVDNIPWFDEDSVNEHYNDVVELITDAIDNNVLSMPSEPKKDKGIWVLNVLESYGGLPPTAKASLYSEEKDALSAKDDAVHEKLDEFASEISKYYSLDNQLPKHYREALTLYCHLRSKPILSYSVPVVEEDFRNLQELERQYPDPQERKVKVSEQYRGTYWYYYRYE